MVSLDDAIIARFEKHGHHFEILVDPDAAIDIKEGKELKIDEHLASDGIFKDAKKGDHAGDETIEKVFGTTDVKEIATRILREGEIQLTTDQRHRMQEEKRRRIVNYIVKNAWNPQAKAPHPPERIERAMEEARVHVDPFKGVEAQVKEVLQALKPLLPIAMEKIQIAVRIPPEHTGHAYGQARGVGDLIKDEWQKDGSWIGVIEVPAGMQGDVYDVLNKATKGTVETKIIK
jgi:ribosome maturation protein SDO1